MFSIFRNLTRFIGWLLIVLIIVALATALYLRTGLPKYNGEIQLDGVTAKVDIIRDEHGIPHIYTENDADAYFALGFVHAQDRLWQMEFQRRVGAGRLSEIFGKRTLDTDKFLRTLSVYDYAERSFVNLDQASQEALTTYTAGVNSYLEQRSGPLPPEFLTFRHTPEPWQVADTLVWLKMMSWDLGSNWSNELLRTKLLKVLSPEQVQELFPPYPDDGPVTLPDFRGLYDNLPIDGLIAALENSAENSILPNGLAGNPTNDLGSNNWVVSGEKTISGMPLLANDPHLSMQTPSIWYFAHINTPTMNVIGASLPGVPFIVLGRNDHIAWGFTNTGPDVQDMFIERLADNPNQYLSPTGVMDFELREEEIFIKGKDEPETITVRTSRHGPIISDIGSSGLEFDTIPNDANEVIAFSWTALRDNETSVTAGLNLNRATNWDEFVNATSYFTSPQQNIVYADVEGNIGYYAAALVPIRKAGNGTVPVPGWTGEYDWTGFIPFEQLPHAFNPASQQIVTANQKVVGDDYPYLITNNWADPYRMQRIEQLLASREKHSVESFAGIQGDQVSLMALEFLPSILNLNSSDADVRAAQALLTSWNGDMDAGEAEGLIFWTWYDKVSELLYKDELADGTEEASLFNDFWSFRAGFTKNALLNGVNGVSAAWCDNTLTIAQETCDNLIEEAMQLALVELKTKHGSKMQEWQWGKEHVTRHKHSVFTGTPLALLFDLTIPNGGDKYTVNAAGHSIKSDSFEQNFGASLRAIYDLSDLENSRFMHTTGQSGHPLSMNYRSFLRKWRDVEYIPMVTDKDTLEDKAVGSLKLLP